MIMNKINQTAIVKKLIPALFLPGIPFDNYLNKSFPVRYTESLHIPVPPILSQFTFLIHICPHTRSDSRQQYAPLIWPAATRVQLAGPNIGHRVGPCDSPF